MAQNFAQHITTPTHTHTQPYPEPGRYSQQRQHREQQALDYEPQDTAASVGAHAPLREPRRVKLPDRPRQCLRPACTLPGLLGCRLASLTYITKPSDHTVQEGN